MSSTDLAELLESATEVAKDLLASDGSLDPFAVVLLGPSDRYVTIDLDWSDDEERNAMLARIARLARESRAKALICVAEVQRAPHGFQRPPGFTGLGGAIVVCGFSPHASMLVITPFSRRGGAIEFAESYRISKFSAAMDPWPDRIPLH